MRHALAELDAHLERSMRAGLGHVEGGRRAGVGHAHAGRGPLGGLELRSCVAMTDRQVGEGSVPCLVVRERRRHLLPGRTLPLARAVKDGDLEGVARGGVDRLEQGRRQRAIERGDARDRAPPPDAHRWRDLQRPGCPPRLGENVNVPGPGEPSRPQPPRSPGVAGLGRGVMVAGSDVHRRTPGYREGRTDHGRQGLGIHTLLVEEIAGDQDRVDAALDRFTDRALQDTQLLAPALGAAFGRQPSEGATQMQVGDVQKPREGHASATSSMSCGACEATPKSGRRAGRAP